MCNAAALVAQHRMRAEPIARLRNATLVVGWTRLATLAITADCIEKRL
jgi:hypothetical protein